MPRTQRNDNFIGFLAFYYLGDVFVNREKRTLSFFIILVMAASFLFWS
jgi:hypothetical protein